ncbi:hypothetical protein A2755_00210 [Candidatus Wolfebacteria bacterium RIFCSPHIGHO2_01_FULL_48_22]|uniref:Toxin YoeB n=2 Tax=Candidatus Wolfeibacteriota TaxID=1752735 RepID=A0A1F8DQT6_9BACT|nr:MAG: hypothetical protein A2755_00210 [Candidatus Wolfebacteria bacterium RIFCSPHIGHO2_01_FULL_48_22]OGM93420.1 MAG: hypothetical protein A2935_04165 [Candidatus Wolfebacteria bacterium RIFCSPLOWO2_01_FULL_47_17b]
MNIEPLRVDVREYLRKRQLTKKWDKARALFEQDIHHPSLNFELLEPHWRGIYSFRIDRKYRALFFLTPRGTAEVFAVTNHYKK